MGQSPSLQTYGGQFHLQNWVEINDNTAQDANRQKIQKGKSRLLKKLITGQQLEQYLLYFNQQSSLKQYINCFQWRLTQQYIVNTKFLVHQKVRQLCANRNIVRVYIQHIPTRLSHITDIPFPQNLYVLKACLYGFQKLFNSIGYFKIEQDFICIDTNAHIKIWFNSDLSKNYPNSQDVFDNHSALLQNKMVRQLIQIIQSSTDHQTQPQINFLQFLQMKTQRQQPTFIEARHLLDLYANSYNFQIPNYFQSMLQIMKQQVEADDGTSLNYHQQQTPALKFNHLPSQIQFHGLSKNNSSNYISLPKASYNQLQFDSQNKNFGLNEQNHQNRLLTFNQYNKSSPNSFQNSYFIQPNFNLINTQTHINNNNSMVRSNYPIHQYYEGIYHRNFSPNGFQKVNFSYSNLTQKNKQQIKQKIEQEIQKAQQQQKIIQTQMNQPVKQQSPQQNYYQDQKRNFRMKSLIQQCQQDLQMSKSNVYLNKGQSKQLLSSENMEIKKRKSLSKSKSKSKHTYSKNLFNPIQSIQESNSNQIEKKFSKSNNKTNKKNMIFISRDDEVYRSQNSPQLTKKDSNQKVHYSQINHSKSKLQRINENPFAQFESQGNFVTMVQSNLNFESLKNPFLSQKQKNIYVNNPKNNLDFSKNKQKINIEIDDQIARDLKKYGFDKF